MGIPHGRERRPNPAVDPAGSASCARPAPSSTSATGPLLYRYTSRRCPTLTIGVSLIVHAVHHAMVALADPVLLQP